MEAPKFKAGDHVRWTRHKNEECIITDGPFKPGVSLVSHQPGCGWNEYSYILVLPHSGQARLVGEDALAPVGQWVNCPGDHRVDMVSRDPQWQRRVS